MCHAFYGFLKKLKQKKSYKRYKKGTSHTTGGRRKGGKGVQGVQAHVPACTHELSNSSLKGKITIMCTKATSIHGTGVPLVTLYFYPFLLPLVPLNHF